MAFVGKLWQSYVATSDFQGEEDSAQLSVKAGDIIKVLNKDDSGWWMVVREDEAGWVPSSYLKVDTEPTRSTSSDEEDSDTIGLNIPKIKVTDTEDYRAIYDYEGEEDSQVSFKEGDIITVVDKEEDGEELTHFTVCI